MRALGGIIAIIIVWGIIAIGGATFWNNPVGAFLFIILTLVLVLVLIE